MEAQPPQLTQTRRTWATTDALGIPLGRHFGLEWTLTAEHTYWDASEPLPAGMLRSVSDVSIYTLSYNGGEYHIYHDDQTGLWDLYELHWDRTGGLSSEREIENDLTSPLAGMALARAIYRNTEDFFARQDEMMEQWERGMDAIHRETEERGFFYSGDST